MDKWIEWPIELHQEEEQLQRISDSSDVVFSKLNKDDETGITNKGYIVSLTTCTCKDFSFRRLPCKHIYKLAEMLKKTKIKNVGKRELKLIADFSSGFAKDWEFAVGTFHWASLDIIYSKRKEFKEKVPTQGKNYHFNSGAVFYNSTTAYSNRWDEALDETEFALQVCSTYPNKKTSNLFFENDVLSGTVDYIYAPMTFDVFRVDHLHRKLEKFNHLSCHADEFIKLLKTGECISTTGEKISTEDWY